LGMEIFLSEVPFELKSQIQNPKRNDVILFSESNSRFIVEVGKEKQKEFERIMKGLPFGLIGCLNAKKEFKVHGSDGKICIKADIEKLRESWREPLRW